MRIVNFFKIKTTFIFIVVFIFCSSLFNTVNIYFQQIFLDSYFYSGYVNYKYFSIQISCIFLVFFTKIVYSYYIEKYLFNIRKSLSLDVLSSVYDKILFNNENSIDYLSIEKENIEVLIENYYRNIILLISEIIISSFSYIYVFLINFYIGFIGIFFMSINLYFNKFFGEKNSKLYYENQKKSEKFFIFYRSLISSFMYIKILCREKIFSKIFFKESEKYFNKKLEIQNMSANIQFINSIIYVIQKLVFIIFSIFLYNFKKITVGELVSVLFLSSILASPLINLSNILKDIFSTKYLRKEILSIINIEKKENDKLEEVNDSFIYLNPGIFFGETLIVKEFNLFIEKNKKYLILGDNGSGKTTFMKMLFLKMSKFRNSKYINQNFVLSENTIYDNIFIDNFNEDEFLKLIKIFNFDMDLEKIKSVKPDNLSLGERQKVIIMKNLINFSEILFLDESLSSINKETKDSILEYILSIKYQTLFYVSHKIEENIFKKFDYLIVIKDKKLSKYDIKMEELSEFFK